jgi:hypothetical protein
MRSVIPLAMCRVSGFTGLSPEPLDK